jgi:NitT/TauT family transport system ATP-binding protein
MSDSLLRLDGASYRYGSLEVLKDINLDIKQGEFVAVVGPSGCGKTTLLNLISGFYKPSSGLVMRSGTARTVYQHDGLFPWLTAGENIELALRHIDDQAARKRQVSELLSLTRLDGFTDYFPHQLSGGMKRRVELARVLAGKTDLLLLDEPFSALDYQTRLCIRTELVRVLDRRPHTVILVTHDIEEAVQLADRVLVLSKRPACVGAQLRLDFRRPRAVTDPRVISAVDWILSELGFKEGRGLEESALQQDPLFIASRSNSQWSDGLQAMAEKRGNQEIV